MCEFSGLIDWGQVLYFGILCKNDKNYTLSFSNGKFSPNNSDYPAVQKRARHEYRELADKKRGISYKFR